MRIHQSRKENHNCKKQLKAIEKNGYDRWSIDLIRLSWWWWRSRTFFLLFLRGVNFPLPHLMLLWSLCPWLHVDWFSHHPLSPTDWMTGLCRSRSLNSKLTVSGNPSLSFLFTDFSSFHSSFSPSITLPRSPLRLGWLPSLIFSFDVMTWVKGRERSVRSEVETH